MRSRIESLTEQLLDRVAAQRRMDVIRDYALPLPTTIIAEMLGVPVTDRDRFHRWSSAVASSSFAGRFEMLRVVPSVLAFLRYIRKLVRLRRRRPGNDLISALVAAEQAGDKLSEPELLAMIFLLLIAGHQTTIHLVGNGTLALLENRAEMEKLCAHPSIVESAVEEMLRYDSPLPMASHRWARCNISIAGATIPQGEPIFAGIAAANRDPQQFERPDVLDLTREPNRHLTFGQGIHRCLGAPLARLEAQIAFTTLLRRFPNLRLAVSRNDDLRWQRSILLRGLQALPVKLD
jgi:cytochrome P450